MATATEIDVGGYCVCQIMEKNRRLCIENITNLWLEDPKSKRYDIPCTKEHLRKNLKKKITETIRVKKVSENGNIYTRVIPINVFGECYK